MAFAAAIFLFWCPAVVFDVSAGSGQSKNPYSRNATAGVDGAGGCRVDLEDGKTQGGAL